MIGRSKPRLLIIVGAPFILLLAGATVFGFARHEPSSALRSELRAGAFDPPLDAPEFALAGSNGSRVSLKDYRGKLVLLTFGFTYCAAVCPTTLATLAQVRGKLGRDKDAVQILFVTVDPQRDDAAKLRDYVTAFDPTFIGATGDPAELARARRNYGVTAEKQGTGSDYAMAHTSSIFLIDRAGKLRAMMPYGRDAADYVHDLELLMAN